VTVPDQSERFDSAGLTDVGVARKLNEDAVLARPDIGLWVVADGMGGHAAGEVASGMIVAALNGVRASRSGAALLAEVKARLQAVHDRLRIEGGTARMMGSTVVVLMIVDDHFACVWAGDSRLYLLRGGQVRQVTRDHSHVQDLIDAGALRPEDADHHPHANVITRAVGASEALELDEQRDRLLPGDVLLLCSDGVSRSVPAAEIGAVLADGSADRAATALIERALAHGSRDNISAVVVRYAGSGRVPAMDPGDDDEPTLPPLDDPPGDAEPAMPGGAVRRSEATVPLPFGGPAGGSASEWMPASPESFAPDEAHFGRYELLTKLGEGAVAEVYQAFAAGEERLVALKLLRPELAGNEAFVARFLDGAAAARRLDHPAIARVYEAGRTYERPFIATAFVDGQALDAVRAPDVPWPPAAAVPVVRQIAEALAYAHAHDVVHGGLKPDNVLIDRDGRVVVTDFALPGADDAALSGRAGASFIAATPQYLSPEQALARPADARSDLFALGAILYCLLAGRVPFAAETMDELLDRIARADPPPVDRFAADVPRGVSRLLDALLQKDPARRPESADAVAKTLAREEARLGGTGPADRLPAWTVWAAIGAAAAAAVVVFLAFAL